MRHESIQTTNAYYVDLNADEIAEDLYRNFGQEGSVLGIVGPAGADLGALAMTQAFVGERVRQVGLMGLEPMAYGLKGLPFRFLAAPSVTNAPENAEFSRGFRAAYSKRY